MSQLRALPLGRGHQPVGQLPEVEGVGTVGRHRLERGGQARHPDGGLRARGPAVTQDASQGVDVPRLSTSRYTSAMRGVTVCPAAAMSAPANRSLQSSLPRARHTASAPRSKPGTTALAGPLVWGQPAPSAPPPVSPEAAPSSAASGTLDHPPYTSAEPAPAATRATISPPGPHWGAFTTHCVNAAASAASTAEPPLRSASIPASVASRWPLATPAAPDTDAFIAPASR